MKNLAYNPIKVVTGCRWIYINIIQQRIPILTHFRGRMEQNSAEQNSFVYLHSTFYSYMLLNNNLT